MPVLLQDAIRYLNVRPGGTYVDATLGLAGHSSAIARELGPRRQADRLRPRSGSDGIGASSGLTRCAKSWGRQMPEVDPARRGVFRRRRTVGSRRAWMDCWPTLESAPCSFDEAHRGFSFQADGPLDMRMNPRQGVTAEQVVNQAGEKELADLIYEFGEERRSRRIARAIVRARPITTTAQLARIVAAAAPAMKSRARPAYICIRRRGPFRLFEFM